MKPRTLAIVGLGLLSLAGCPRAATRQDVRQERRDDRQDAREERRDDRQDLRDMRQGDYDHDND